MNYGIQILLYPMKIYLIFLNSGISNSLDESEEG